MEDKIKTLVSNYFSADEKERVIKLEKDNPEAFSFLLSKMLRLEIIFKSGNKVAFQSFLKNEDFNMSQFYSELETNNY